MYDFVILIFNELTYFLFPPLVKVCFQNEYDKFITA